jgi:hypothetical protein
MEYPSDKLVAPSDADPIPDLADFIINQGATALLSPSYWILEILSMFNNGENPLDEAMKIFTGDWNQASEASSAVKHVAEFHEALSEELRNQGRNLQEYWEGNAADAATAHLNGLADAIDAAQGALAQASGEFKAVAIGMYEGAQNASGWIQFICDDLISMALTSAATACLAATGVGAAVGTAALLAESWLLIDRINKLTQTYALIRNNVVSFSTFATANYLGAIHTVSRFREAAGGELPSYDFPWA